MFTTVQSLGVSSCMLRDAGAEHDWHCCAWRPEGPTTTWTLTCAQVHSRLDRIASHCSQRSAPPGEPRQHSMTKQRSDKALIHPPPSGAVEPKGSFLNRLRPKGSPGPAPGQYRFGPLSWIIFAIAMVWEWLRRRSHDALRVGALVCGFALPWIAIAGVYFALGHLGEFLEWNVWRNLGYAGHSSGAVFFDYNRDGLLDLFVCNVGRYTSDQIGPGGYHVGFTDAFDGHLHPEQRNERSILYENRGNNRFVDVTEERRIVDVSWSGDASPIDVIGARIRLVGGRGPDAAREFAVADEARRVDPGQPHVPRSARYFGSGRLRVRGSGDGLALEGPDLARFRGDDHVPGPIHRIRIGLVPHEHGARRKDGHRRVARGLSLNRDAFLG